MNSYFHSAITIEDVPHIDYILHDRFSTTVEKDLHRFQGPGVVTKSGRWVITDKRNGSAMYGHC